jgi:uncharacterized protein (DUF58 family)
MGISGFFGRRNLTKVDIDAEFPQEIYANKGFPLRVRLKNKRRFLPAFLMRVKIADSSAEAEYEARFPFVDKKGDAVRYLNISFNQRGRHEIKDIYICSVFPFSFFVRCKKLDKSFGFIVFPEPKKCEIAAPIEREKISKGERHFDKAGYEADIISIREYIQGDPFKYINWKATAKTGGLKTKELSTLAHQPVVIDFEKINIRNIEEKISCITYMILQLLKKNIPVGLRIGDRFYKPDVSISHKINILRDLALYGINETIA